MAEKFGLDWKRHDHRRMRRFISILAWEAERSKRADGTAKKDPKQRFRPRG